MILKQSTAVTLKIGPFIDDTDGKTAETGLTIGQADVRLSKNGADIAQKNEASACTHDELGIYGCPLNATDTNTLGILQLWVHETGALPVWHEYMVVPANVYDALFSTDLLQVHAAEISNGLITAAAIATGAVDADALAADAAAEIADAVWDEALSGHAGAGSAGAALSAASAPSAAQVADAVWDEALSGHAGAGSAGAALSSAAGAAAGAGAITYTYTLTSSVDASPIPDADVWVTSDSAGNSVLASGRTNSSGQVTFYLDAGTVYIWRQKAGWNFSNPQTATIS